jgi:CubicO group peptidase (beta-lactamase class C family)
MKQITNIKGHCEPQFEALKNAFENNFINHNEVGAAIALVKDGELVVNLWGGEKDPDLKTAWQSDTVVNVWSTTKGITALCFAMLVDRGQISYQTPIAEFWPEFRTPDKQHITLAMLLSHQAGLCGFREPVITEDLYDLEASANKLATMKPLWEPGTGFGYHAMSIGLLASVLMKRVDGRSLQQFVQQELQQAFNLDLFIGLPQSHRNNAATSLAPEQMASTDIATELSEIQLLALANPVLSPTVPNTEGWRDADIPSANGFASAKALATLYGAMAGDGSVAGKRLLGRQAIQEATTPQVTTGVDKVLGLEARWANGFLCNTMNVYGPNQSAFGHSGWGGSFAFADPENRIGFAYTMNRMGTELIGDPRGLALVEALYAGLVP